MHERAPIGMEAAKLLVELQDDATVPSGVTVAIATDVDFTTAQDAWDSATDGTPLAGVPVDWVVRRAVLACLTCATKYEGDKLDRCPSCGGDGLITDEPPTAEVVSWSSAAS